MFAKLGRLLLYVAIVAYFAVTFGYVAAVSQSLELERTDGVDVAAGGR